jgi:glycosyltransferase involved in cell wall biosynthesis
MSVAARRGQDRATELRALRVVHLLAALRPSGAERMLQCSFQEWQRHGVDPIIVGFSDQPHPFAQDMRRAGYETVLVEKNSRSIAGLAALRSTLARLRPDVVHVHNESMFPLVCALARAVPGVRGVVRSIHTNFRYHGLLAPRRVLFSRAAAAIGVVSVACGEGVADNEERRYRHRPRVVENWVDVAAFAAGLDDRGLVVRDQLGLTKADFVVMILGNCEPAKRHFLVLDAVADVQHPLVLLHIGGEERADEAERASWRRVAAPHRLIRLGRRSDVAALLAAADVLAMPSDGGEGFGLAAAESFCARTPVVGSVAPGLAWMSDFRTGRTVEWNTLAWADQLERAAARASDPRWAQACHEDAEQARRRFTPERGVAEWCAIYDMAARSR